MAATKHIPRKTNNKIVLEFNANMERNPFVKTAKMARDITARIATISAKGKR